MPPRRVLPIRSRLENTPSKPRAGGDGEAPAAASARSATSAGGSSVGATATAESPGFKTKSQASIEKHVANKEGRGTTRANGRNNSGDKPTKGGQALPEAKVVRTADKSDRFTEEDILVAIIKGKQVSVRVKLNAKKPKANKKGKDKEAAESDARPKRKRNNLFSSLSPAVMRAAVEERAMTYAEAPQRLRRNTKANAFPTAQVDAKDVHPVVLDAENAAQASGGKVPQEYLGQDGNLFYCRICLGVGEVVCCDGCPHVFHPSCIPSGLSKNSLDNDDDPWYCPECVEKGMCGKSIVDQPKKKRAKVQVKDEEKGVDEVKKPSMSPPRRSKKRCGTCNKKAIENFPLVECSKQSCTALLHFPGCPDRVDQDDLAFNDTKFGPLCPVCSATFRVKNKDKSSVECGKEKSKGGRGGGRGSGKGGRGAGKGGTSSNGGKGSYKKSSPPREQVHQPIQALISSGYQAPYQPDDEDTVGPDSLAFVEKPTESIPAFFFFLLNNRNAIERSLQKKNRAFRSMPKSLSRNEMVAEEGAAIWVDLTEREKRAWVDLAIDDFQERVIAWKEKEAIEAMMQVDEPVKNGERTDTAKPSNLLSSDDTKHAADFYARTLQFSKVKTTLMKPSKGNNNSVLSELLQDGRFHPVPLVCAFRDKKDMISCKHGDQAIEQFAVQGPIRTSIGDACTGCERGWLHFCPVLKFVVPNSASRALLQPPTGSMTVERIGLGLEGLASDQRSDTCQGKEEGYCPNYQPRESTYLQDPSLRRDDATTFIEDAMAVKTLMPDPNEIISKLSSETNDTVASSRKRKRPSDSELIENESLEKRRYKCGRCSTVQYNPFGCNHCRREQLVKETATNRDYISPSSITSDFLHGSKALSHSHNYDEGFVKPKCVMLHQTFADEISLDGRHSESKFSELLTKESWTPNAILPYEQKVLPTPNAAPDEGSEVMTEIDDNSSASDSTNSSHDESDKSIPSATDEQVQDNINDLDVDFVDQAHDLRKSRRIPEPEVIANRQVVAVKHKESANELSRRCLSIACSGILMGMIRRDPLRLFAKPAPSTMEDYYKVIKEPIDFQTMRQKLLSDEYATLGSFINDAKRLCINSCVFNAADSLYALTAKAIYDSLIVMIKRAQQWIAILKNTHASSFVSNDDSDDGLALDIFKDVESMWPGAVALLSSGSWLEQEAKTSDFIRTKENELAYYGALSLRRASVAACESFSSSSGEENTHLPVAKRSHIGDELLREKISQAVSFLDGPACLKEHPDWREEQLLKILKVVQRHRIDHRNSSEAGCARCEVMDKKDRIEAISMIRSSTKHVPCSDKARVDSSRSFQSTGLSSHHAQNTSTVDDSNANESKVSVKGSEIHGWGLFSDCTFKQGDTVAEYIGEYINNATADAREKYYRKQRIQDYQFRVSDKVVIDATLKGGYARYINHSCQPNCLAKIIDGEPPNVHLMRVMIIAQRDIEAAEELTYDYHFPLETELDNRVPCNCGSKHCRGYMNWDIPEKMKKRRATGKLKGRVSSKKV